MTLQLYKSAQARLAGQVALLTVLSVLSIATPAGADTCLDRVDEIAAARAIETDPPDLDARTPPGATSDALSGSGGVIEPPRTSDRAVIAPPEAGTAMATVPDAAAGSAGPDGLTAADAVILQSLLVAARAEAERGDEEGCFKRLEVARDFLRDARQ